MELQTLSDVLRRAERLFGDRTGAVCCGERFTYSEVADRARRLARLLLTDGIGPGDRVATLMGNCHRYLETYFAVPGIGAVIVPLNNHHAIPEMRYVLQDAGVKLLITDAANGAKAEQLAGAVPTVIHTPDEYEARLAHAHAVPLDAAHEQDLAGLFYTGGTTGAAKGVMLTHRNLVMNALHATIGFRFSEADVHMHAAPMFHLADGCATYAVTWAGGSHTFVPAFDPAAVLRSIQADRVSSSVWVPTMLNAIINHPDADLHDLGSLRLIIHGGSPIAEDLLRRSFQKLRCSFSQVYGMTEAAPILTLLAEEESLVGDRRLRSAGREVIGVEVSIRRADGSECLPGEVGEVVARGPNLMSGYWNKAEETAAALRNGWYWTGDLAQADADGYVYIVDRSKDMIISGGENVYSTEVENAISAHPDVLECAVIGIPDDRWGEAVHAVVAPRPGSSLSAEELREYCKSLIAAYKVPRSVDFVDALPKSGAGKILKRELREKYWVGFTRAVH